MSWEIAAAGTVTLDDVTTPHGRRTEQQGGSAVYFALAASRFTRVHLVGAVGQDGEASLRTALRGCDVACDELSVLAGPTMRWRAVHDYQRWVTASEETAAGVSADWRPRPGGRAASAPVLFAGSMAPWQQEAVIAASTARLVGVDTMTVHIGDEAEAVLRVVEGADVVFVNASELAALTGTGRDRWLDAARGLCGRGRTRLVVVKRGPLGAACVTADTAVEAPAHEVVRVIDPTGAGDALAGGFLGICARSEQDPLGDLAGPLDAGLRCAAAAISGFGLEGLLRPPS